MPLVDLFRTGHQESILERTAGLPWKYPATAEAEGSLRSQTWRVPEVGTTLGANPAILPSGTL